MRPYVEFLTILPFVVPPIILVVGVLQLYNGTFHAPNWFLENPHVFLVATYVILAFPYVYRSLDAGFRAIDVHTLTEASQSLGATWTHDPVARHPPEHPHSPRSAVRSSPWRS